MKSIFPQSTKQRIVREYTYNSCIDSSLVSLLLLRRTVFASELLVAESERFAAGLITQEQRRWSRSGSLPCLGDEVRCAADGESLWRTVSFSLRRKKVASLVASRRGRWKLMVVAPERGKRARPSDRAGSRVRVDGKRRSLQELRKEEKVEMTMKRTRRDNPLANLTSDPLDDGRFGRNVARRTSRREICRYVT